MTTISLKLPEDLLEKSGRMAEKLQLSRSEYIRRAIDLQNRNIETRIRAERIAAASRKVRSESMRVNAEFSRIESEPK
jgi:metal-responsive CopG/Arc/MetJ family transcriptional regulator